LTLIKKLLAFGVDINLKDQVGANAIFYAIFYKQIKLINYLIENNANINQKDNFGNSALSFAKENKLESLLIR
jgi:ankyrin repeat protein